jgi:ketosteroid isomerase-like protein
LPDRLASVGSAELFGERSRRLAERLEGPDELGPRSSPARSPEREPYRSRRSHPYVPAGYLPAMSQESVEVVRRVLTTRQDEVAGQNEIVELLDPAVRLDLSERVFNPEVYEGYEGITRWRAHIGDVWESYSTEPEEFFDGDEVVVVFTRERGRGRSSGVEVDRRIAFLCRLRAGRVSEIRLYQDREQALRDAELPR